MEITGIMLNFFILSHIRVLTETADAEALSARTSGYSSVCGALELGNTRAVITGCRHAPIVAEFHHGE